MKKIFTAITLILSLVLLSSCTLFSRKDISLSEINTNYLKAVHAFTTGDNYLFCDSSDNFRISFSGKFNDNINLVSVPSNYDERFKLLKSNRNNTSIDYEDFGEYAIVQELMINMFNSYKSSLLLNPSVTNTTKESRIKLYDEFSLLEESLEDMKNSINTCNIIADNNFSEPNKAIFGSALNNLLNNYNKVINNFVNINAYFNTLYFDEYLQFNYNQTSSTKDNAVNLIVLSQSVILSQIYNHYIALNGQIKVSDGETQTFITLTKLIKNLNLIDLSSKRTNTELSGDALTKYLLAQQKLELVKSRQANTIQAVKEYQSQTDKLIKSDYKNYIEISSDYNVALINALNNLLVSL